MKRFLFSLFTLALCLGIGSGASNIDDSNLNQVNPNNLVLNKETNKSSKSLNDEIINTSIQDFETINIDLNSLNFYKMRFNGDYYVADISQLGDSIVELKLICDPSIYNSFGQYQELRNENFILEVIKYDVEYNRLMKFFSKIADSKAMGIVDKSLRIEKDSDLYFNLLASLNAEYSYKSMKSKEASVAPCSVLLNKPQVDNQSVLDYYINITKIQSDAETLPIENKQEGFVYSHDDSIVNLIPKSYFKNNGFYSGGGSEWGYFVKTYNDFGNNKIASLLIYDVFTIPSDSATADVSEIKVVLHRNYKY